MSQRLKNVGIFCCLFFFFASQAQQRSFSECEFQLNKLFSRLKKDTIAETQSRINDSIYIIFSDLLQRNISLDYDFKNTGGLKKIVSLDKRVAVYSWCYLVGKDQLVFNGIVQRKGKTMEVYPLASQKTAYVPSDNQAINTANWYGALYFDIFPFNSKQGKAYVLLGWSQNNPNLTMKLIDVLWFDKGEVRFGLPIFEVLKNEYLSRVVFQYNNEVSMTVLYEAKKHRFVFDHLAPINMGFVGDYRYYAPDSSYDAYKKKSIKKKWIFQQDVEVENN